MIELAPIFGLRLRTPRLELRLGSRDELVELGRLAERGIHSPDEMPFAVAWTDRVGEDDFLDEFVAFHERHLDEWSPGDWTLNLLVWEGDELAGTQALFAGEFAERRWVATGSWLGGPFQRRGIGTEMRAAVLELAFRGLGAVRAESSWLEGNEGSRRVSVKLGYVEYVLGSKSPRGTPVVEHGVEIERSAWRCPVQVEIEGLEPCLALFGLSEATSAPT
ncbi:MAG TPA: GNAT family protein [Gaiellaceae bacterium]|nr:GNAT family protein [Gaiellaceae bacterium]